MTPLRLRPRTVPLAALALISSLLVAAQLPASAPAQAAGSFCRALPGLTANVWQGAGVGPGTSDAWAEDANWSTGTSPMTGDKYVCIPAGGTPFITGDTSEVYSIATMDIASGARLRIGLGAKVVVFGDQASQPSTVRGRLEVLGAGFGGDARLDVLGSVSIRNLGPGKAASLFTRLCRYYPVPPYPYPSYPGEEPCFGPDGPDAGTSPDPMPVTGTRGLLTVADSGVVDVEGGGVNLGDQYQLVVRGLLRFRDRGFLAADHGASLELRPRQLPSSRTGTLRIESDGGVYEGFIERDTGIAGLATVVNDGLIEKTGGGGLATINADYSQTAAGRIAVTDGTLLLPEGPARAASVGPGDSYGTGRCFDPTVPRCQASTFDADRQNARLRVPRRDPSGAAVRVRELAEQPGLRSLGAPFLAHADHLRATRTDPAILTFRIDERLLAGRGWKSVDVLRKANGSTSYVPVVRCLSDGRPPVGSSACVDRRGLASSSHNVRDGDFGGTRPDVVMVVRTTATSRWICR
ncbi:hypothetical protein [Nocardioides rubriscoriae]|uniref:hypothetical protein n=1 Tax=Nocardioides rubriscoriae TaxID=642762 RepID=UPI0011DF4E5C|nr:hypothetical protein [Nocardioides rubriscoriae]